MLKGLIIREPWIGEILAGRKTWELRSRGIKYRGEIALIRQGSGAVVGFAEIVECLAPLSRAALEKTREHHAVPREQLDEVYERNWRTPWVLANIRALKTPVPYLHPPGAVITVNLSAEVARAIKAQINGKSDLQTGAAKRGRTNRHCTGKLPTPNLLALATDSGEQRAKAIHSLPHLRQKSFRSITDSNHLSAVHQSSGDPDRLQLKDSLSSHSAGDGTQPFKRKAEARMKLWNRHSLIRISIGFIAVFAGLLFFVI